MGSVAGTVASRGPRVLSQIALARSQGLSCSVPACRTSVRYFRQSFKSTEGTASRRERSLSGAASCSGRAYLSSGERKRQVAPRGAANVVERVAAEEGSKTSEEGWEIKMLYDGECPLCMREVNMLRRRDAGKGRIKFVDIAGDDYSPEENAGITFEEAMGRIHGIERDGRVVTNVAAFRRFYEAVDLGWVYAVTKYKPVLKAADAVYDVWAKYRLQLTGRPSLEKVLEGKQNRQEIEAGTCTIDGRCRE